MRLVVLSDQLTVSHGGPLPRRLADGARTPPGGAGLAVPAFGRRTMRSGAPFGINAPFGTVSPPTGQVVHVLLALPPLSPAGIATFRIPFDLHA